MLYDNYKIRSDFRQGRRVPSISLEKFLNEFSVFFHGLQQRKSPNLYHSMCDPYGFALLCKDYKNINEVDLKLSCKENYLGNGHGDESYFLGQFSFQNIINFLYQGYWFDKGLANSVYQAQGSALNVFKQIIHGQGYVMNRYGYDKQKVRRYMNYAMESKITLNEDYPIPKPYIHHVCDGMVWPCIVTKHESPVHIVKKVDIHGWGEGLVLLENEKIIDVLKINDLWLTDTPLENRLKFTNKILDYETQDYLKVWNWREGIKAGKLLKANSTDGILLRSCHENYLQNRWFAWNKTSYVYCYKIKGELKSSGAGKGLPQFYTLEGDLGAVNPVEEKKFEKIWLDDFDIQEFKKILELK